MLQKYIQYTILYKKAFFTGKIPHSCNFQTGLKNIKNFFYEFKRVGETISKGIFVSHQSILWLASVMDGFWFSFLHAVLYFCQQMHKSLHAKRNKLSMLTCSFSKEKFNIAKRKLYFTETKVCDQNTNAVQNIFLSPINNCAYELLQINRKSVLPTHKTEYALN